MGMQNPYQAQKGEPCSDTNCYHAACLIMRAQEQPKRKGSR